MAQNPSTKDGGSRPISLDGDQPEMFSMEQLRASIVIGIGVARRKPNAERSAEDIAEDVVHMVTVSELRAHDV